MHIPNKERICKELVKDKVTRADVPCDREVYAKDQCRRCYNRKRWYLDYETERARNAKLTCRAVEDIPRRQRRPKTVCVRPGCGLIAYGRLGLLCAAHYTEATSVDRVQLLEQITEARTHPNGTQCQMPECENTVYGRCGICQMHYSRERALRKQLKKPRLDRRMKFKFKQARIRTDEIDIRREAAARGVPPGRVAQERGLSW